MKETAWALVDKENKDLIYWVGARYEGECAIYETRKAARVINRNSGNKATVKKVTIEWEVDK